MYQTDTEADAVLFPQQRPLDEGGIDLPADEGGVVNDLAVQRDGGGDALSFIQDMLTRAQPTEPLAEPHVQERKGDAQ